MSQCHVLVDVDLQIFLVYSFRMCSSSCAAPLIPPSAVLSTGCRKSVPSIAIDSRWESATKETRNDFMIVCTKLYRGIRQCLCYVIKHRYVFLGSDLMRTSYFRYYLLLLSHQE